MEAKIRHIVAFTLIHPKDSPEAEAFLKVSREELGDIPSVAGFRECYEISPKNGYEYGFSFDFMSVEDYNAYSNHPRHLAYVEKYWKKEVKDFAEVDLQDIEA